MAFNDGSGSLRTDMPEEIPRGPILCLMIRRGATTNPGNLKRCVNISWQIGIQFLRSASLINKARKLTLIAYLCRGSEMQSSISSADRNSVQHANSALEDNRRIF